MKLPTVRLIRAARALWRIPTLSGLLLLAAPGVNAQAPGAAAPVHERISPPDRPAEIGCFGTSPESPDGRMIAYVVYDKQPSATSDGFSPGGLYRCDVDPGNRVKLRDIARVRWHDGAMQLWIDNDTLAYTDFLPDKGYVTYVIRRNGDLVRGPIEAAIGHGDTPDGAVLLIVDGKQFPHGSNLGSNGLYLYKDGAVTQVVKLEKDLGPLKDRLKGSDNPAEWVIYHALLSTQGTHISIRLDTGPGFEHIVTCRADGTDVRLFGTATKPLHQQWYDDSTLFAHDRSGKPVEGGPRLQAKRWDRDGKVLEILAGAGNHLGISPDRRYLASENMYELDPVVLKLYRTRKTEPLAVIMNVPAGPIWKMRTHVNPAFSRDGRKVYFNKPIDGMPQVHRVNITDLMRAHD